MDSILAMKKALHFNFISPASPASPTNLENCRAFADFYQAESHFGKNCTAPFYDLAGTDTERLADFNQAFFAEADAIFAIRGGYGSARLLDALDYEALQNLKSKVPFFGYSDTTALQLALWGKSKIKTFSGLLPGVDFTDSLNPLTATYFKAILEKQPLPTVMNLKTYQTGQTTGILLGGCLSVLNSLLGTKFCPDFTGSILFLEEVNEPTYVIDRLLNQLKSCGILQNIAGLVFGAFTNCQPRNKQEFPLEVVLKHYASFVNGPVCYNLPYGHVKEKIILPLGGQATLDGAVGTLTFLNEAT